MLYQQIAQNKRKTVLVMAGFFLLVALIGAAIGYLFARSAVGGVIIAGVIALVYMAVIIGQSTLPRRHPHCGTWSKIWRW